MKKYIIATSRDYADEFCYPVISKFTEVDKRIIIAYKHYLSDEDLDEIYFGTNEWLEFTVNEVLTLVNNAESLTEEEEKIISKFGCEQASLDIIERVFDILEEKAHEAEDQSLIKVLKERYVSSLN